jgi:GntR family histidine utilization transcriptional repressor
MTVHHAVRDLCKDGLLTRLRGSGTFVAHPLTHLTVINIVDIAQEITGRGHEHKATVIERLRRSATVSEAKHLNIEPGSTIFHTVVLHWEDGIPLQLEDRIVNAAMAPEFLEIDYTQTTSFSYLMRLYPYPAGRHVIHSIGATDRTKELLRLQPGEPCLEIERTTWIGTKIVTWVRLIHPGFRYALRGAIEQR